jgi:hypothetical protein
MSYSELKMYLSTLDDESIRNSFSELDQCFCTTRFGDIPIEQKISYAYMIKRMPTLLDKIQGFSQKTILKLRTLYDTQQLTTAKTLGFLCLDKIYADELNVYRDITALNEGPVVIFAVPKSGNALKGNTTGLYRRNRRGAYPPTGVYHAATILDLLGVRTYVFDLDIEDEFENMLATIRRNRDSLYFVSISSRFMDEKEFKLAHSIRAALDTLYDDARTKPFVLGGGIGPVSSKDIAINSGYLDGVVCGIAPFTIAEMIFDTDYIGPDTVKKSFSHIFAQVPNLTYYSPKKKSAVTTHIEQTDPDIRLLIAETYSIAKIPYETRYWPNQYAIAICSPDDLNISVDATSHENGTPYELHPSNYLFKLHMARFLSVIGNCPRNCRFCHWHTFDHARFIIPYENLVKQLERAYAFSPHLEMIGWLDEDFLIWKHDVKNFLDLYKKSNTLYPAVRQSLETLPQYITVDLLAMLREANFKGVYLGYESPIKRLLHDMRKLRVNESYEVFRKAPYLCYDAGFVTRCSTITFYPEITEEELADTLTELLNLIDYGISIEINPYVVAVPGSEMSVSSDYTIEKNSYRLVSGEEIEFLAEIQPNNPVIKQVARYAVENVQQSIDAVFAKYAISADHDMSFEVVAFFLSIIDGWNKFNPTNRYCEKLQEHAYSILSHLSDRHTAFRKLHEKIKEYAANRTCFPEIEKQFRTSPKVDKLWYCLQMFVDLGEANEIATALEVAARLHECGYVNPRIKKSEEILTKHPIYDIAVNAHYAYRLNETAEIEKDGLHELECLHPA